LRISYYRDAHYAVRPAGQLTCLQFRGEDLEHRRVS